MAAAATSSSASSAWAFVPSINPNPTTLRRNYLHNSSRSINSRMKMIANSIAGEDGDRTIVTAADNASSFVDPYSEQAKHELFTFYTHHNLPTDDIDTVHKSLLRLTECVISWNEKLNLVSRKECTPTDVYHKHVMPSVALLPLLMAPSQSSWASSSSDQEQHNEENKGKKKGTSLRVVDIGTGGGFPGLPLALLLPQHQFTLVDSIRKKLVAVSDMASELGLSNVRIHCGRAEEMRDGHRGMYHVALGRSVTALPNFCSWIYDLLMREGGGGSNSNENGVGEGGRLIYIIGGEIDDTVQSRVVKDIPIDELLQRPENSSDKRALIFTARGVREIAKEFLGAKRAEDEMEQQRRNGRRRNPIVRKSSNTVGGGRSGMAAGVGRSKKPARGAWSKKENDGVAKQRGYDDFQRYESSS